MPTAVPTGAHDPPNKIRLVLELYGLFFDELFGHVPERPHSSSQPLDQARDMPPYHRMMVRVVLILLMPGAAGAELNPTVASIVLCTVLIIIYIRASEC